MPPSRFATGISLLLAGAFLLHAAEEKKPVAMDPARVPFPGDYAKSFEIVRTANKPAQNQLGTIYANAPAAAVRELTQLPYSDGAVLVMEWAEPQKGPDGALLTDADGTWRKGAVVRVDVMRRAKEFGAAYGDKRAGTWEFASYRPDGSAFTPAIDAAACAACHARAASRDFVFRGRFPAIEQK